MSVSLTSAERVKDAAAPVTYTQVGESKREGNVAYAVVESSAAGNPLYLQVTRDRKDKIAAVKRYPLAPLAAAIRLGVIE